MKEEKNKKTKIILRIIQIIFILFSIISFFKIKVTKAETIDYLYSQPFGIKGNAGEPAGYVQLYNSGYGGATNNFKYGTYPFMLLEQNLIQFNENNNSSGNFEYILMLSICQTTSDMTLDYDSGSIHSYVRDVNTIGAIESGTCNVNVYTGRAVNYYIYINATKRINENCNSNYCVLGQQLVLRWASNNYNEFKVMSQQYYEYTDEIASMLANAKSQEEINTKLQQQIAIQQQQINAIQQQAQQEHQDALNTQNAINGITNADYNGNTEQPNTSNYDDYEEAEDDLLDNMSEMDLNDVTIAIDTNSSNFVWNTMTSLIQSNAIIFSMIISILSIGVIKLMLGR